MSYASDYSVEDSFTPLVNILQLISLPIVSFAVITPLCLWSGYSVLASFLTGWLLGLVAIVMLIVFVYARDKVQASRALKVQAVRRNVASWERYHQARRTSDAIAEWDMDALADQLDAVYQNMNEAERA